MQKFMDVSVFGGNMEAQVLTSMPKSPTIILIQEIFGINDELLLIASDLNLAGYTVVCPDLFWRAGRGIKLSSHQPRDVDLAFKLYNDLDIEQATNDVIATIEAVRSLRGDSKVGLLGYCLGGLLSFLASARGKPDAAVSYYGGGIQRYLEETSKIDNPLMMHLAGSDEYIGTSAQIEIRSAAIANGIEAYTYKGRDHAFARPGGTHFNLSDTKLAWSRTMNFFDQNMIPMLL